MKKYLLFILIILVVGGLIYIFTASSTQAPGSKIINSVKTDNTNQPALPADNSASINQTAPAVAEPISNALSRITKKPFGIKISPYNSPVSPEKFSGYHTGTDFETTAEEKDIDVPIYAICSGPLALKKSATGYGGVAVQSCNINNQDVTVVYGHLRLSSISTKVKQELESGGQIGFLGTGYGQETDGERKHLHLAIHRGKGVSILGYTDNPAELDSWIDVENLLR